MSNNYKSYAFISYSRKDEKWAKWLQRKLESYKLPTTIHNEYTSSKYLRPVFRDKTDLNTGILASELRNELDQSKFLIVICSPNSAKSKWVSEEVRAFIEQGRINDIIPFIVDGTPQDYQNDNPEECKEGECFPCFLRQFTKEHPDQELLGINIKEVGKEPAFIRVVSKMLAVDFDTLWKRNKRQKLISRMIMVALLLIFIISIGYVWRANQPFDLVLSISEQSQNKALPFTDGVVEIELENDTLRRSVVDIESPIEFKNIPSKYRDQNARILFNGFGFNSLDTLVDLSSAVEIVIQRNPSTYGLINGQVKDYDDMPISEATVTVGSQSATTDINGFFTLNIPLAEQLPSDPGYVATVTHNSAVSTTTLYPDSGNNINNIIYIQ